MELQVDQVQFSHSLQNVSRFVAGKSQLPILNNILFEATKSQLKLTATNLELTIQETIPAKVDKPGKLTVPASELTEFVSYLSPDKVFLSLTETGLLQLTSGKQSATFTTQPPEDFPPLPTFDESKTIDLPYTKLSSSLEQVLFAAAADDTRPVLMAILTTLDQEELCLVATDGFRLSRVTTTTDKAISKDQQTLLVPARAYSEVLKLSKGDTVVKMSLDLVTSQICFYLKNCILVSRLLQGDYPDYNRILPKNISTTVTLDRADFTQAIKSASVFARSSANVVRFKIGTGSILLESNAPQLGKNQAEVEAKIVGKPLEIAFNFRFLLDFLSVCKSPTIEIGLNEPLTPALFKDSSLSDLTHVIMPVRLQD